MNFRLFAIGAAAFLASGAALAAPKDDVLKAFGECAAIRDDAARLACYDRLIPRVNEAVAPPVEAKPAVAAVPPIPQTAPLVAAPPPVVVPAPPPPVAAAAPPPAPSPAEQQSWFGRNVGSMFGTAPEQQTTPEKFGSDKLAPPPEAAAPSQPQELDSITANVADLAFTPFGKFIVFLDNGQIWRQLEGDADRAHFKKDPKDNKVTISRGSLGSYNLTINDSAKLFKVTRVK